MGSKENFTLSELEMDTLQELMNISFGKAAADLAEVVDIFIELKAPRIECIHADEVLTSMKTLIPDFEECSIVEQHYYGEIKGVAVLVFPAGADRELLSFFQEYNGRTGGDITMIELEREVIMELGNILIGACLGNLFTTLKSQTTYLPPWTNSGKVFEDIFLSETVNKDDIAITMRTIFKFEDRDISGHLYIINSNSSMKKIQIALADYWKQFNAI
ncbi:MAG: chemotaxis protein CheC [Spirochaetales bacterium]|nr:chemotaxis protein CheC [Spirochaetales bacterium]